jgi:hypothetical protein
MNAKRVTQEKKEKEKETPRLACVSELPGLFFDRQPIGLFPYFPML